MKAILGECFTIFKKDALSRHFYDLWKCSLLVFLSFAILILGFTIPNLFNIKSYLFKKLVLTPFDLLLLAALIYFVFLIFLSFLYRKKYRIFREDYLTDDLTGLQNHIALKEYLEKRFKELVSSKEQLSCVLIDIDDFKQFNTTIGHDEADQIVKGLGALLASDKRATDKLFRKYSQGDEFIIIANDTSIADAIKAADRKRELVENNAIEVNARSYYLKISCGVAGRKEGDDPKTILNRASLALAEAKKYDGKNCTKAFY